MKRITNLPLLGLLLIMTTSVQAETWQLGVLSENGRSPFIGDTRQTNTTPSVNYIGERFSFLGGKIEYGLKPGEGGESYIVVQIRQSQFYSSSQDLDIEGMKDRDQALELGLGIKTHRTWGQLVVEGLFDVTGVHEGYALTTRYSYPLQMGRWLIEPAMGLQLQSSDLVDYYHGVTDTEALIDRPAYQGDRAINKLASLMLGYSFNARLLALVGIEQTALDSSISDSPIVDETQVQKVYLGLIYTF